MRLVRGRLGPISYYLDDFPYIGAFALLRAWFQGVLVQAILWAAFLTGASFTKNRTIIKISKIPYFYGQGCPARVVEQKST